jgi:spore coat polysaccharide biosynthesis protein SpsF
MLKTLGIVEARLAPQAARCHLHRRLGGQSLLEWVVRRVTDSTRLSGVIVLAADAAQYDALVRIVPADVPVFVSGKEDALGRFLNALEEYQAEAVVRVRGDNAFIDPGLIDRLITVAEALDECDYASFASRDGQPAVLSPVGIFAEWFRTASLRRAAKGRLTDTDREHVTRYVHCHPEKFRVHWIPAPAEIDRDDVRLTIDLEEDWENALVIFEALGPERLDWRRIAELLDHQPAMRRRMAALNREYCHS